MSTRFGSLGVTVDDAERLLKRLERLFNITLLPLDLRRFPPTVGELGFLVWGKIIVIPHAIQEGVH